MNFSKYIFAPWVRQGLSNNINETDHLGSGTSTTEERAEIAVKLNWTGASVEKTAQLIGPGDIKSISEDAILKVSPLAFSRDMEPNYLPFIEFYEEDFPWRYTPASPTDNTSGTDKTKLRPWLALVVLEDDNDGPTAEFTFNTPQGELPFINVSALVSDVFHSQDEHWAWAHVQYNPDGSTTLGPSNDSSSQTLVGKIVADADRALSRIICPRRLEENKNYRAFLIPAFETGRLAGLGEPIAGVLAQQASWGVGSTTRANEFPVYKEWAFRTSTESDFETLAKKLKPEPFDGEGGRNLAIEDSGYGVIHPGDTVMGTIGKNVKLEGALKPTDAVDNHWPATDGNAANDALYIEKLSNVLNLNESLSPLDGSAPSPTLTGNPFSTTPIVDDPIVSPPIYGQWHFLGSNVPDTMPTSGPKNWFSQINLNPAWRAAAGLGTKVIRENQEAFMERAWQQVGEINKANEIIRLAELVKWTNKRIAEKRIDTLPVERFMKMNSSLMKKVQNGSGKSLHGELQESELPEAVMDNGFRKMTRSRGIVAKKASHSASLASPVLLTEYMISTFEGVQGVSPTVATSAAPQFSLASAPVLPASSPTLMALNATLTASMSPILPKFDLDDAINGARVKIQKRTDNFYQVARTDGFNMAGNLSVLDRKIVSKVSVLDTVSSTWSPVENRKPIMAYPKFDDIIGDYIKKIDTEYILPEIAKVENNSVTLMETNPKFLESLFLGLNHEMSRELLWREFPTDQRGTYFRQFWDKKDVIDPTASIEDIKEVHQWADNLGDNTITGDGGNSLVLVVKGDLLRKFPDAIIYAQKAGVPTIANGGLEGSPGTYQRVENVPLPLDTSEKKHPIFSLTLDPDITIIGFSLEVDEARNTMVIDSNTGSHGASEHPGWYFVFAERPGKPRFGLDVLDDTEVLGALSSWSDLMWEHLGSNQHISSQAPVTGFVPPFNALQAGVGNPSWGTSSAEMAYITFQKPALVAIHAEKMLPPLP